MAEERENGRAMEGVGSEFFKHENWKEMRGKLTKIGQKWGINRVLGLIVEKLRFRINWR